MVSLTKRDVVAPVESADALALAIEQRARHADNPTPFTPSVVGAFTHGTTVIETTIGVSMSTTTFFSATSMTSAQLVTACSTVLDELNQNRLLINRLAYILEANGMTS